MFIVYLSVFVVAGVDPGLRGLRLHLHLHCGDSVKGKNPPVRMKQLETDCCSFSSSLGVTLASSLLLLV